MIKIEKKSIQTDSNKSLATTFYYPEGEIKAAIIIAAAMAVNQKAYAPIATWLAEEGYMAVTFDYFGMGLSRAGDIKDVNVTIVDWAQEDCAAIIDATIKETPDKALYWLGHSVGSQIIGLIPNRQQITKIVTIASGTGYWKVSTLKLKWLAWFMWLFIAPLAIALNGYFPGKRLGMVGDLPKGVMHQWRRWCLKPNYLMDVEGEQVRKQYHEVAIPITSLSFTDDEFLSDKNTESLHSFYKTSPKKMIRLAPEDLGLKAIGHFGFFKESNKCALWEKYLLPELD